MDGHLKPVEIDLTRLRKQEAFERQLDQLRAKSKGAYGAFDLETLEVNMLYDDEQVQQIYADSKAMGRRPLKDRRKLGSEALLGFLQAWAHEHVHLLQVLLLRMPRVYAITHHQTLQLETVIALRHLEKGLSYNLSDQSLVPEHVLQALVHRPTRTALSRSLAARERLSAVLKAKCREPQALGLTVMDLIEGMAHEASLHMISPDCETDRLGLSDSPSHYCHAYQAFCKAADASGANLDLRWRRLIFCHFAWVSLSVCDVGEPTPRPEAPVAMYAWLLKQLPQFVDHFCEEVQKGQALSDAELRQRAWRKLRIQHHVPLSPIQARNLLAMSQLAHHICAKARVHATAQNLSVSLPKHRLLDKFKAALKAAVPHKRFDHLLLHLMLLPDRFFELIAELRLDEVRYGDGDSEDQLQHQIHADFYRMFQQFRSLLDNGRIAPRCCEKHGIQHRLDTLACKEPDSLLQSLAKLLGREASELVSVA